MRLLLAENNVSVRRALRLLLSQQPGMVVVGEAANALELLYRIEAGQPDALLLDWRLPGMPGQELLPTLAQYYPSLKVAVMSVRPEDRRAALAAGATCFVSKADPPQRFVAALNCVREGDPAGEKVPGTLPQPASRETQLHPIC